METTILDLIDLVKLYPNASQRAKGRVEIDFMDYDAHMDKEYIRTLVLAKDMYSNLELYERAIHVKVNYPDRKGQFVIKFEDILEYEVVDHPGKAQEEPESNVVYIRRWGAE